MFVCSYAGSAYIVACRKFVQYVLNNKVAKDFLKWVKDVRIPEEHFFNSLNFNPHLKVPGSPKSKFTMSYSVPNHCPEISVSHSVGNA